MNLWQRAAVGGAATGTIGTTSVMGLSISEVTTTLLAIGAVVLLLRSRFRSHELLLLTFVAVASAAALVVSDTLSLFALQQLAALVVLVAGMKAAADGRFNALADDALLLLAGLTALFSAIAVTSDIVGFYDFGTRMFGLIGTVAYVTGRRSQHLQPRVLVLALVAVAFSSSRTAVGAIVMFELLQLLVPGRRSSGKRRRARGNLLVLALLGSVAIVLRFTWGNRFAEQGDNVSIGGATVNTNGRRDLWDGLLEDMGDSLLVGKGVGAASLKSLEITDNVLSLPHNEFLRFAFDFGVAGSIVIWATLLLYCRRARCSITAIVTIAVLCVFDNVFVYLGCTVATVMLLATAARDSASSNPPPLAATT